MCAYVLLCGLLDTSCGSNVLCKEDSKDPKDMCLTAGLMHCAEKKGGAAAKGSLLAETCVASSAFVSSLQEKALAEARCAAAEALKQRKASQGGASTSSAGRLQPRPPTKLLAGCWCASVWGIACSSPARCSLSYLYIYTHTYIYMCVPLISIVCICMRWRPGRLERHPASGRPSFCQYSLLWLMVMTETILIIL